jgi:citrate lyase subunit beta / citryl-CoA lyase
MSSSNAYETTWGTSREAEPRPTDIRWEQLRTLVRRSALFVPANVPRFVEKAHTRGADAIILDLEDSVPVAAKQEARDVVREDMRQCARGGADIIVRINHPSMMAAKDLERCVWPGLDCIMFPKAESPREVELLDQMIGELEVQRGMRVGSVQLWILIESVLGLHNAQAIALASQRIVAIGLGAEDFTLDIGVESTPDGRELFFGKAQMIVVARLAGVQPVGTLASMADYHDTERLARVIQESRRMGFMGSSCIHPAQVKLLNRYFSPTSDEVTYARRVIAAFEEAEAEHRGSVGIDGKMIDIPVVERARHVIVRAEAIEAKEARKRRALEEPA